MYINDVDSSLKYGNITRYADDIAICFSLKTKIQLEIEPNEILNSCVQRLLQHNLKRNIQKSYYMAGGREPPFSQRVSNVPLPTRGVLMIEQLIDSAT